MKTSNHFCYVERHNYHKKQYHIHNQQNDQYRFRIHYIGIVHTLVLQIYIVGKSQDDNLFLFLRSLPLLQFPITTSCTGLGQ